MASGNPPPLPVSHQEGKEFTRVLLIFTFFPQVACGNEEEYRFNRREVVIFLTPTTDICLDKDFEILLASKGNFPHLTHQSHFNPT